MEKYFRLAHGDSILIYGAGSRGAIFYEICQELKIPVLGFVDKRGDEISEFHGLEVWNIDGSDVHEIDENVIIFVAVKNVFEHDNIVRQLCAYGFSNIIYQPLAAVKGNGNPNENLLHEIYDGMMERILPEGKIPKTFSLHQYEYKDYSTIKKLDGERVVYIPVECLFTDKKKGIQAKGNWIDLPIMALIPHIDFFRWMNRQEGYSPEKYLQFCIHSAKVKNQIKITERWKDNVVKNRADVYRNMNESLERDSDFFIRNASEARWNINGYFNLVSGKHRVSFLIAKGRRYIPLRISEADYERWLDKLQMESVIKKMQQQNVYKVNAPIEHPFFYDITCENGTFYYQLLFDFIYMISTKQYEAKGYVRLDEVQPVLVSLDDDGYFARALQRYGVKVYVDHESMIGTMLNILIKKKVKGEKGLCRYAFVEHNRGHGISVDEIIEKRIKYVVILIADKDASGFEKRIELEYSIIKKEKAFKDNKITDIYWLENKNVIW